MVICTFTWTILCMLAKRRKLLSGTGAVQKLHMHDTNMCTQWKRVPAVGYWHSLLPDSCSEPDGKQPFQFCSKPHPNTSISTDSQAGISTERQQASGQRSQIPAAAHAIPLGKDWGIFGVERREAGSSEFSNAALGRLRPHLFCTQGMPESSVGNLSATESCRDSFRRDKQKKKKRNKASPKAVVPNPWVKPS